MIYRVRHINIYTYAFPISSGRCTLRLLPNSDREQTVIQRRLEVEPPAAASIERSDFFGNIVVDLRLETKTDRLRIATESQVDVHRAPMPAAALTDAWEIVRRDAAAVAALGAQSPVHGLFPSTFVPLVPAITAYARESFAADRPVVEGALDLTRRIRNDFKYQPGSTAISTPIAQAFAARSGVCQDFAHIMIAGLRGLGIPAAYVSGYIRTIPPAGKPRLEGADASHAWVSVWCGRTFGWLDFDPTNAMFVSDDHIRVAFGRDYTDVSPIYGVVQGSGDQDLEVSVDVLPLGNAGADAGTNASVASF